MEFRSFVRQVGGASTDPLVGSDPVPSGVASLTNTCAFSFRIEGKSGVGTIQRLGVTYAGPAATLPVSVWVFDQKTSTWVLTGQVTTTPNGLTRADLIAPLEDGASNVAVDVYVQVEDPGGLANGVYTFLVSPDSSTAVSVSTGGGPAVNVAVTNFPATFPSTVISSALPTGAATEVKQDAGNTFLGSIDTELASIDTKTPSLGQAIAGASSPAVLPAAQETSLRDISDRAGRLLGHTTVDASALPAGAATETKQNTGNASLSSIDTKTPSLGQALAGASTPVVLPSAQETSLRDISDRAARLLGHVAVDSSALPSGAATETKQDVGNTSLSSIDTKIPSLGQALAGASVPSVLPAAQETSLRDVSDRAARLVGVVTGAAGAALALDATLTGGTAKSIVRGGTKGATTPADITSTPQGADHQGIDAQVRDTSGNPMPSMDVAARKGFVAVTDGTSVQAVKAASTAAQATDPSAVVALSPNSSVPAGNNVIGKAGIQVGGADVANANPVPVVTPTGTITSLADISVTTAAALGSLAAGPSGILVTAHPNNTAVIRVSGSDVSTTKGQPLSPGASFIFSVTNASGLSAAAETGTQTLCVSAV